MGMTPHQALAKLLEDAGVKHLVMLPKAAGSTNKDRGRLQCEIPSHWPLAPGGFPRRLQTWITDGPERQEVPFIFNYNTHEISLHSPSESYPSKVFGCDFEILRDRITPKIKIKREPKWE